MPVTSLPSISMRPPTTGRMPASASTNSRWPLPSTPAIPKISPARTEKIRPDDGDESAVVGDAEVADLEHGHTGMRGSLLDLEDDIAPDHEGGQALLRRDPRDRRSRRRCPWRSTVMRSATASTSRSLCVMNTIDLP